MKKLLILLILITVLVDVNCQILQFLNKKTKSNDSIYLNGISSNIFNQFLYGEPSTLVSDDENQIDMWCFVTDHIHYSYSADGMTYATPTPTNIPNGYQRVHALKYQGMYYLYAAYKDTTVHCFTSTDKINFIDHGRMIWKTGTGSVSNTFVWQENGQWKMLYDGRINDTGALYTIGLATSNSALGPWEKYNGNPVITAPLTADGCGNPEIIQINNEIYKKDGKYFLYYMNGNIKNDLYEESNIHRAYSYDLTNWINEGPLKDNRKINNKRWTYGDQCNYQFKGQSYMLYSPSNQVDSAFINVEKDNRGIAEILNLPPNLFNPINKVGEWTSESASNFTFSGSNILTWLDKSGNNNNWNYFTGEYSAYNYIDKCFINAGYYSLPGIVKIGNPMTIILIEKSTSYPYNHSWLTATGNYFFGATTNMAINYASSQASYYTIPTNNQINRHVFRQYANICKWEINGVNLQLVSSGLPPSINYSIEFLNGTYNIPGNIYALVIYNTYLTDAQVTSELSRLNTLLGSAPAALTVDYLKDPYTSAKDSDYFKITSNTSWTVSSNQSWATPKKLSGTGNDSIYVVASANTGALRTAIITVTGSGITRTLTFDQSAGELGANYYLSPSGSDSNNGDIDHPFATLTKLWTVIQPGELAYLRGGNYSLSAQVTLNNVNGTSGNLIKIWAYPGETPVFVSNGSYKGTAIKFCGSYFHWKGIEIKNFNSTSTLAFGFRAGDETGFGVATNNNIFETLNIHHNVCGFVLSHHATGNTIINCDFHHNYSSYNGGSDSDGIEISYQHFGMSNIITGCRAWDNGDDGIDFSDNDALITCTNNWSWHNGFEVDGSGNTTEINAGDGLGFKLGWNYISNPGGVEDHTSDLLRIVANCLSFKNYTGAFSQQNGEMIMHIYNNTSFNNVNSYGWQGYAFGAKNRACVLRNNISYLDPIAALTLSNMTVDHNTWNSGFSVSSADFVSVDQTGTDVARQADGSLPVLNFLKLTTGSALRNAGTNLGYGLNIGAY